MADKKWADSGRLACTSSKTEVSNKVGIYILILNFKVDLESSFTKKNLKIENNNP